MLKLRDAVNAEAEALQKQLEVKTKELERCEYDVVKLQAQVNSLMVEAVGPSTAPKRAGDSAQGLQAIKLYLGQDDGALATPEYNRRKADTEAVGLIPFCPLRWHVSSELGQLGDVEQAPPSKRTCTVGVAGEHMQEDLN